MWKRAGKFIDLTLVRHYLTRHASGQQTAWKVQTSIVQFAVIDAASNTRLERTTVMEIFDYSKLLQDGLELRSVWGSAKLRCHKMGDLVTPHGKIVACDPFVFPETPAFSVQLSPGRYPVLLSVADFGRDQRVAFAAVLIRDGHPHHWELALLPGQDVGSLEPDDIFCYGVDSGTGCFMDPSASEVLTERMNDDEDYDQTLIAEMDKTYVHTWSWANLEMDPGNNANLIAFSSGLGDGCYPSYFGFDEKNNPMILVTDFGVFDDDEIAEVLGRVQHEPGADSP